MHFAAQRDVFAKEFLTCTSRRSCESNNTRLHNHHEDDHGHTTFPVIYTCVHASPMAACMVRMNENEAFARMASSRPAIILQVRDARSLIHTYSTLSERRVAVGRSSLER